MRNQTKKYCKLATDYKRYKELKKKLNPTNASFIEVENTADWREFNGLTIKLTPFLMKIRNLL